MSRFVVATRRFITQDEGATMVEYGLMLALVAIVVIAGATLVGTSTSTLFSSVAGTL